MTLKCNNDLGNVVPVRPGGNGLKRFVHVIHTNLNVVKLTLKTYFYNLNIFSELKSISAF